MFNFESYDLFLVNEFCIHPTHSFSNQLFSESENEFEEDQG